MVSFLLALVLFSIDRLLVKRVQYICLIVSQGLVLLMVYLWLAY
jgi:hypothetical protein